MAQLRFSADVSPTPRLISAIRFPVNVRAIDVVVFTAGVNSEKPSVFEGDRRRIFECPGARHDPILPCRQLDLPSRGAVLHRLRSGGLSVDEQLHLLLIRVDPDRLTTIARALVPFARDGQHRLREQRRLIVKGRILRRSVVKEKSLRIDPKFCVLTARRSEIELIPHRRAENELPALDLRKRREMELLSVL